MIPVNSKADKLTKIEKDLEEVGHFSSRMDILFKTFGNEFWDMFFVSIRCFLQ